MGRKKMSIDDYREQLATKYGEDIVEDFDAVFSGDIRLIEISRKYKLSKMRISQLFERLYGKTYREATRDGNATDSEGTYFSFEPGVNRQLVVILPDETYVRLKKHAKSMGVAMAVIVRDSLTDFFRKDITADSIGFPDDVAAIGNTKFLDDIFSE